MPGKTKYTDQYLIEALRNCVDIHNKIPSKNELHKLGCPSGSTYSYRFKSWENALAIALDPYYGVESCYIIKY